MLIKRCGKNSYSWAFKGKKTLHEEFLLMSISHGKLQQSK